MKHISALLPTPPPGASQLRKKPAPSSATITLTADCPLCKGAGALAADVPFGHPDFGRTWPCPDRCHNAERLARLARLSGLTEQDLTLRLTGFRAGDQVAKTVIDSVREFMTEPSPLLYIWGGYGNGKTLLLKALVNEFNATGRLAVYTKFTNLLWWMRQVFGDNGDKETYLDRYERIKRVPVLAIDELDKVNLTAFAQEFQFDFLDERYEAGLRDEGCTMFASNSPPDGLPPYLASRVLDGRCRVIENAGPDLRPRLRK